MKGEIFQMCNIITAAKNALATKSFIQYEPRPYEHSTQFRCVPEAEGEKGEVLEDVESWFARCMYNGIEDIKYIMPPKTRNHRMLGMANTTQNVMVCFYPDDKVTMWTPHWRPNRDRKTWDVLYQEKIWVNHPEGRPSYKDNTEEFKAVLERAKVHAKEIDEGGWADVFDRSIRMLEGNFDYEADDAQMMEAFKKAGRNVLPKTHLKLPKHNLDVYEAAVNSNVFGAIGSWSDRPAVKAHEKELDEKYMKISTDLYFHMSVALMYAMNEW